MYEDSWYSYVPEVSPATTRTNQARRRGNTLLQQPHETANSVAETTVPIDNVYEEIENTNTPPEATVRRRAASTSDFYRKRTRETTKETRSSGRKNRQWEALTLSVGALELENKTNCERPIYAGRSAELLEASQEKYLLYGDQLMLTEVHLDGLIHDANKTLDLLTTLSNSFKAVEAQTSSFQSQCEDLLSEQQRLEYLAEDVGTDLRYYTYLDTATRRLNAPGAGRLVDGEDFGGVVEDINACIEFMTDHENYRDHDTYLARYNSLLTKALHLLDHGFTSRLEKIMSEIGRQIAETQSESARHALAYGRFEEMVMDTYFLVPNVQRVIRHAYDQYGRKVDTSRDVSTYINSATNIFQTYLTARDRELKVMTQHDLEEYKTESKNLSIETASRNFIKQSFERVYNEETIFIKIFNVEPSWSNAVDSAFHAIKGINTTMIHPGHFAPLGSALLATLQPADLQTKCNIASWLASEYSVAEYEDDESPFLRRCREYAARVLIDVIWPFIETSFEAEITKSISKATIQDSTLNIGTSEENGITSHAHPLVKRATNLLAQFDQAMPKERSAKNSSVVFKIVRETIQFLQKAEARIRALKRTDADIFMIKNLLIIKNELVSLEFGDIRGQSQASSLQHFGHIWETLSPQNWGNLLGSIVGGSLGGALWSRGTPTVTAKTMTVEDMSEQLDEILRQSIYAFTNRWASLMIDSQNRKAGVKPIAKIEAELANLLQTAFSHQPEITGKLKEAIGMSINAQTKESDGKKGIRRY
ncbi:hypothetical protein V2G26_017635 [Clonostachys chloroleuca]